MPTRGEIAATFDAIASEFDATRTRPWPETLVFESRLSRGVRVLDLGCGNGRNAKVLIERGHAVIGLDASGRLLQFAAAKIGPGSFVMGDIAALPFRPASFDAVHCVATIHHLPSEEERRQMLAECMRVLRPGGVLLLSAWAAEQDRFRDAPEAGDVYVPWKRSDGTTISRFYHLFREGEVERLLFDVGFALERAWREGDNHVALAVNE